MIGAEVAELVRELEDKDLRRLGELVLREHAERLRRRARELEAVAESMEALAS